MIIYKPYSVYKGGLHPFFLPFPVEAKLFDVFFILQSAAQAILGMQSPFWLSVANKPNFSLYIYTYSIYRYLGIRMILLCYVGVMIPTVQQESCYREEDSTK